MKTIIQHPVPIETSVKEENIHKLINSLLEVQTCQNDNKIYKTNTNAMILIRHACLECHSAGRK